MARACAHNRMMIERQRVKEQELQHLQRHLWEVTTGTLYAHSERRVEALRRKKELKQEQKELEMDELFTVQEQEQQCRARLEELDSALAVELRREEAEKIRKATERKRICDDSEELRDLKEKLRMAKVNKERAAQIIEQQIRLAEEYNADTAMAADIETCRLQQMEEEKRLQLEHVQHEKEAKLMQKQQIAERCEARRMHEEEEYSRDKEQVRKLMMRLLADEQTERQQQQGKREQEKKQREEMLRLKELWCKQQRDIIAEEEEKIRAYAALQAARQEQQEVDRQIRETEKRRVLMELSKQQMERDNKEKEYLELLSDLHREEKEEQDRKKEKEERLKKLYEKELMLRAFDEQMAEKERLRELALAQEKQYRQNMLARFAEEDRLEQLNDQKKRVKLQEHLRQAELHVQERRRRFEQEREADRQERKRLLAVEQEKEAVVQDERRRLLGKYADLMAFLPKGTFKAPEEQQFVQEAGARRRSTSREPKVDPREASA